MKRSALITLFFMLCIGMVYSQVPKTFNYQAVARDENGNSLANQDLVVEVSVHKGSTTGSLVWQEVHYTTTNAFGLFTIEIGGNDGIRTEQGSLNAFTDIDWSNDSYYIQTRVDFGKSEFINGFIDMGTVKLTSVPYSLVADSALKVPIPTLSQVIGINESTLNTNDVPKWDGTKWAVGSAGVSGSYLNQDGTTDLTGDWTISSNNLVLTSGNITLTNGNITLTNGLLSTNSFSISGTTFTSVSTDLATNSLATALVTASAVKSYVDNNAGASYWSLAGGKIYNTTNFVGVGTSSPEDRMHIALIANEGFLITGSYSTSENLPNKGAGTRFTFYPARASLRAGTVSGSQWDNSNVGQYSYALGNDVTAKGDYTFAVGTLSVAQGNYSTAIGRSNTASNSYSVAMGTNNTSSGVASTTLNYGNTASGAYSTALGFQSQADGDASIAAGQNTLTDANANGSLATGNATQAYGLYSMVMGDASQTNVGGEASFAGGNHASTYGKYAFAFGDYAAASSYGEFAIGRYNTIVSSNLTAWDVNDRVFVIGIGTDAANRADAVVVKKNGDMTVSKNLTVNGTFSNPSDIRLKKDITPMDNALEKIKNINSVYYYWKKDEFPERLFSDKKQIGFIAQDVEKVLPELVRTDNQGYKSVDYAKMTVLLLQAIKEQQKEIELLKQKLEKK